MDIERMLKAVGLDAQTAPPLAPAPAPPPVPDGK
jgi:hypothetical protein